MARNSSQKSQIEHLKKQIESMQLQHAPTSNYKQSQTRPPSVQRRPKSATSECAKSAANLHMHSNNFTDIKLALVEPRCILTEVKELLRAKPTPDD
jgi:hypothetical protein